MILTDAELLALRAVVEVAEPSADDAGPMEIWATAMTAMKKIEDDVKEYYLKVRADARTGVLVREHKASEDRPENEKQMAEYSRMLEQETKANVLAMHDSSEHTCQFTVNDYDFLICGKPATMKWDDDKGMPEYFCQEHYNQVRSLGPDSDIDCGWSAV